MTKFWQNMSNKRADRVVSWFSGHNLNHQRHSAEFTDRVKIRSVNFNWVIMSRTGVSMRLNFFLTEITKFSYINLFRGLHPYALWPAIRKEIIPPSPHLTSDAFGCSRTLISFWLITGKPFVETCPKLEACCVDNTSCAMASAGPSESWRKIVAAIQSNSARL